MTTQTVQINPSVALAEASALAEHYRQRALVNGQRAYDIGLELEKMKQELNEHKELNSNDS